MRYSMFFAAVLAAATTLTAAPAKAQVSLSVQIGPQPVCPYGYFGYAPYRCAPFGYYGPAWFPSGFFIGAGPWFRGGPGFRGWVDRRYDPRFGYRGPFPQRGERGHWEDGHWRDHPHWNFHGDAMEDGRGQEFRGGRGEYRGGEYRGGGGRGRGWGRRDNGRDRGRGRGHGHDRGHGHGNDHGHGHGHGHDH